jgi:bacteriocin-like protein
VAAGLDLPEWIVVSAREGDAPELTITVPELLDPDAELSEEQLATVSGGCGAFWCEQPVVDGT